MVPAGRSTAMESAFEPLAPMASVARTVKLKAPAAVGAPEITPVLVLHCNPPGRAPAVMDHVCAPVQPLAASV